MASIFQIQYTSINEYEEPVSEALFEFLASPCTDNTQILIDYTVKNSINQEAFYGRNSYGFQTIRIRQNKPFTAFQFVYNCRVEKLDPAPAAKKAKAAEQAKVIASNNFLIDNFLFLSKTPLTVLSEENKSAIKVYNKKQGIEEFLTELNEYIHSFLKYEAKLTTVNTTADEVMKLKKGVCQDFTHVFIGMARENKIPCRYVSGYLDQGTDYVGSSSMHAWAEALVPGVGWIGFDPANNCIVNSHYIKVCHGSDYNDCSPIKGILIMPRGENKTLHQVKVVQQ
jgi:transglutaminase-like putative cysteine protease